MWTGFETSSEIMWSGSHGRHEDNTITISSGMCLRTGILHASSVCFVRSHTSDSGCVSEALSIDGEWLSRFAWYECEQWGLDHSGFRDVEGNGWDDAVAQSPFIEESIPFGWHATSFLRCELVLVRVDLCACRRYAHVNFYFSKSQSITWQGDCKCMRESVSSNVCHSKVCGCQHGIGNSSRRLNYGLQ